MQVDKSLTRKLLEFSKQLFMYKQKLPEVHSIIKKMNLSRKSQNWSENTQKMLKEMNVLLILMIWYILLEERSFRGI